MRRTKRLIGVAVGFAAIVGLVFPGTAARATFPGVDGRIAFSDFITGQIYAMNPDGSGLVQLTHVKGRQARRVAGLVAGRHAHRLRFEQERQSPPVGDERRWQSPAHGG